MAWSCVQPLDVLINITGASIGRSALVPRGFQPANVNQHVCVIRPFNPGSIAHWLALSFKASYVKTQVWHSQNGAAREGLNFEQLGAFRVIIAPSNERPKIFEYVEQRIRDFDVLIGEVSKSLELLHERRSALISAAVTGKIDVRGWQPPADESAFAESGTENIEATV